MLAGIAPLSSWQGLLLTHSWAQPLQINGAGALSLFLWPVRSSSSPGTQVTPEALFGAVMLSLGKHLVLWLSWGEG